MAKQRAPSTASAPYVEGARNSLTEDDLRAIAGLDKAIADAEELARWWHEVDQADTYADRFPLSATHHRPETSFGFFGETQVSGSTMSVMGNVQEQLYDRPKSPSKSAAVRAKAAEWTSQQVREFVLRYFMKVIDFRQPESFPGEERPPAPFYLRPLSWVSHEESSARGFGFEQLYYKLKGDDPPQKFDNDQRFNIVDLREIGSTYEWIVVKVIIFDFKLRLAPFGQDQPHGTLPQAEHSLLVLTEALIVDDPTPQESDDLGRYGLGYAFLPAVEESLLAFGPGRFEAACQLIRFHVKKSGEVKVRMAFVANRPEKVIDVSVDPVSWGLRLADLLSLGTASSVLEPVQKMWQRVPRPGSVDVVQSYINLANTLTGGIAAKNLGVSKRQLHKNFLAAHFDQNYNVVAGSLMIWRQIPDWLDQEALPDWVRSGRII